MKKSTIFPTPSGPSRNFVLRFFKICKQICFRSAGTITANGVTSLYHFTRLRKLNQFSGTRLSFMCVCVYCGPRPKESAEKKT